MKRVKNMLCNTDAFRCMFMFLMIFSLIYKAEPIVGPYVKFIVLPWGYFLLLRAVIVKRTLFRMKYVWIVIAFLVLYVVTILLNLDYLVENVKTFAYMVLFLLVVYPPDIDISQKSKYRWISLFNWIFIVPVSILSLMSLLAYITSLRVFSDNSWLWFQYYAISTRVSGFYMNANVAGRAALIVIAMLIINWMILANFAISNSIRCVLKIIIIFLLTVNMAMLTLTGSRAARYSLLVFVLLFSFIAFLRFFSTKWTSGIKRCLTAVLVAAVITGIVYATDRPIRLGAAYAQFAIANAQTIPAPMAAANVLLYSVPVADKHERLMVSTDMPELYVIDRNFGLRDNGRILIYRLGWELIRQNPLFGVSSAAVVDRARDIQGLIAESAFRQLEPSLVGGGLHNIYIHIAAANGLPSLAIFMVFIVLFFLGSIKKLLKALSKEVCLTVASLLALCAALMFLSLFEDSIFYFALFSTVVFWSGLSFASSLLAGVES